MLLSSLRNFFISLFITLVVFGVAAYFVVEVINDNLKKLVTDQTATNNPGGEKPIEDVAPPEDGDVFTVLVLGIDDGQSQPRDYESGENHKENETKKEADTIFLVNINAITKVLMISSLPSDMRVEVDGYRLRLGAVYPYGEYAKNGRGMEFMRAAVHAYTGLTADYCFVLDYDSVETIIDSLGPMEYTIPEDMYYKPVPYDVTTTNPPTEEAAAIPEETEATTDRNTISIKRNELKTIDGATAVQILRYKNYKNEDYTRDLMQINFVQELIKQKMTVENLARADKLYEEIKESLVGTDMDGEAFKKYSNTLFTLSGFTLEIVSYPGSMRVENGTAFFDPIQKSAQERYNKYRAEPSAGETGAGAG